MKWFGLTGGLGTGKSTVAKILVRKGNIVIDADEMAHLALSPGQEALTKVLDRFGPDLMGADGKLDRRRLGRIVFSNPKALADLEAIVHPAVKRLTYERRNQAARQGHKFAFYDVPLLFEKLMQKDFDKVIVVSAPESLQIERAMKRSGLTQEEVLRRIANQIPIREKVKLADFVIDNSGAESALEAQVDDLIAKL